MARMSTEDENRSILNDGKLETCSYVIAVKEDDDDWCWLYNQRHAGDQEEDNNKDASTNTPASTKRQHIAGRAKAATHASLTPFALYSPSNESNQSEQSMEEHSRSPNLLDGEY